MLNEKVWAPNKLLPIQRIYKYKQLVWYYIVWVWLFPISYSECQGLDISMCLMQVTTFEFVFVCTIRVVRKLVEHTILFQIIAPIEFYTNLLSASFGSSVSCCTSHFRLLSAHVCMHMQLEHIAHCMCVYRKVS